MWYPIVPCVVPLVPCAVPIVPWVVPLVPCVVPLVPCVVPIVPCMVPPVPCVVPLVPWGVPLVPCVVPLTADDGNVHCGWYWSEVGWHVVCTGQVGRMVQSVVLVNVGVFVSVALLNPSSRGWSVQGLGR